MFGEADVGDFRICVSAPRHNERAGFLAPEKERILNHNPRGRIRGVSKFPL